MISWSERIRRLLTQAVVWLPVALPLYLIRFRIGPLPTTLLEVLLLIFFVAFTVVGKGEGWKMGWQRVAGWRVLMIAWTMVTLFAAFTAPHLLSGLGLWRAYILEPMLVFVCLGALVTQERERQLLARSFLLVVFPLVIWAAFQFLTGKGIPHPWDVSIAAGRRATGPYPYPNALALFITPIIAYAFARWVREPREKLPIITFVTGLLGILLVRSDGGLIATIVVAALVLLGVRWGRSIFAALVGGGILVLSLSASLRNSIVHLLTFQDWSGRVRVWMWQETWQMLKAHWFTGAGLGGYPVVFDAYHKKRFIEIFQYPHTILFNFWSETGLLGVFVFLAIVVKWVKERCHVLRTKGYSEAMIFLAPLLAMLIHGLVDVPYFKNDLALEFWLFAFLTTATFHMQQVDAQKKS